MYQNTFAFYLRHN